LQELFSWEKRDKTAGQEQGKAGLGRAGISQTAVDILQSSLETTREGKKEGRRPPAGKERTRGGGGEKDKDIVRKDFMSKQNRHFSNLPRTRLRGRGRKER